MKIIEVPGKITEEGKLIAENAALLSRWIEGNKNHSVKITIERYGSKRTSLQNRYYWGVCVFLIKDRLKDLGHALSDEEVHDFLKKEFNYKEIKTEEEYFLKIPKSTKMDKENFADYIERVRVFASAVLEIIIPDPDDNYYSLFKIT